MKYRTIVADPPWKYDSAATKADAAKHYATMRVRGMKGLAAGGGCGMVRSERVPPRRANGRGRDHYLRKAGVML